MAINVNVIMKKGLQYPIQKGAEIASYSFFPMPENAAVEVYNSYTNGIEPMYSVDEEKKTVNAASEIDGAAPGFYLRVSSPETGQVGVSLLCLIDTGEDIHFLGEFRNIYEAVRTYPCGGGAEDYITILGVPHYWNVNRKTWSVFKDKEENLVRMVEDYLTNMKAYISLNQTEFNVSRNYPTGGTDAEGNPEGDRYTLEKAVYRVPAQLKFTGVRCSFLNMEGKPEVWQYQGGTFTDAGNWERMEYGASLLVLEYRGSAEDTRLQVEEELRKPGLVITYHDGTRWVQEQYAGTDTGDSDWKSDMNWKEIGTASDFVILPFKGNRADTRLQVEERNRKSGLVVTYPYGDIGWVQEQYVGDAFDDGNWQDDGNWAAANDSITIEVKKLAEKAAEIAATANATASQAKAIADSSMVKVLDNERVTQTTEEKVDDLRSKYNTVSQNAVQALGLAKNAVKISDRGVPNGVPVLDSSGKVPQSQLPVTQVRLVDSYMSGDTDKAPTAAALHRLYEYHEEGIAEQRSILEAVLDMVGDSVEMGVSPTSFSVTSEAQEKKVQIVCNGEWTVSDVPESVEVTPLSGTGSGQVTVKFSANDSTEENVSGSFKISNSFGKEKTVSFVQYSASTRYVYTLRAEPSSVEVDAVAGRGSFNIVSTRRPYINDTPSGEEEQVPYTLSVPEGVEWMRILSTLSTEQYEYDENTLEAARSTVVTASQEDGGETLEIWFTQAKAEIHTRYTFAIEPVDADIEDNGAGSVYPAKITSTKTVTINGETETTEVPYDVSYEGGVTSGWVIYDKGKGQITVLVNEYEDERSGAVVFTQEGVEANIIRVNVTQAAATVGWNYIFEIEPEEIAFGNSASSRTFEVKKCVKRKTINGVETGDEEQVEWKASLDSDVFSLEGNTVFAPENTGERRTAELVFNRPELGEDDRRVVPVVQEAGIVSWTYTLEASASPTSLAALGGTTVLTVTSKKQKLVNGKPSGQPADVSWHAAASGGLLSGEDVSGSTWAMQENRTESARRESLVITQLEEGGKTMTLEVTQLAGEVTWEYAITASPTSLSFGEKGETKGVSVTSVKQKRINGKNDGSPVTVGYTRSDSGTGVSGSGTNVTMAENTSESSRSGKVTFTQNESGKTATVSLSQSAAKITYTYSLSVSSQNVALDAKGTAQTLTVTSKRQKYVNDKASGGLEDYDWNFDLQSGFTYTKVSQTQLRINGSNNTTTNQKTGQCIIRQKTDGGKSATINVTQSKGVQTTEYDVVVNPNRMTWSINELSTKSAAVSFVSIIKWNGIEVSRGSASGNITRVNATANVQQLFDGWYSGTTVYVQKNLNQVGHGSCEVQTSRGNITITLTTTN